MKLSIDPERCQGHGRCVLVSMELFDVDDDGNGVVLIAEPGPEFADDARKAVGSCPEQAISYG
ncbi:ferredoxin [uncultured Jatrophihabitans sp.]|uniref:ferredoxin n=1 Tax=uncultured Jatrophihabitans sp. TaxID=1610747 RepID=UPI0035C96AAA